MSTPDEASVFTPREVVSELDRYIVGQAEAKRAVAIALRNRWRRQQVPEELRDEIAPKNIIMIGPTGVGKTEVARRLAKLAQAPFLKVEASKFTEVGYVGRDVESIVRDLTELGINPSKISLSQKDFFYILDMSHKSLDKVGKKGKKADRIFDTSNRKVFLLESPSDVETTADEEVLVTDSADGHVITIDKNGKFVLLFAAQGTARGQLLSPVFQESLSWSFSNRPILDALIAHEVRNFSICDNSW